MRRRGAGDQGLAVLQASHALLHLPPVDALLAHASSAVPYVCGTDGNHAGHDRLAGSLAGNIVNTLLSSFVVQ